MRALSQKGCGGDQEGRSKGHLSQCSQEKARGSMLDEHRHTPASPSCLRATAPRRCCRSDRVGVERELGCFRDSLSQGLSVLMPNTHRFVLLCSIDPTKRRSVGATPVPAPQQVQGGVSEARSAERNAPLFVLEEMNHPASQLHLLPSPLLELRVGGCCGRSAAASASTGSRAPTTRSKSMVGSSSTWPLSR